ADRRSAPRLLLPDRARAGGHPSRRKRPHAPPHRLGIRHARERARDAGLGHARPADGSDGGLCVRPDAAGPRRRRQADRMAGTCARRRAGAARGDARSPPLMPRGLWVALLATVAAACQEAPAPPRKPLVVASFYPMYEFSRQVAGDRAEVVSLVPPGGAPHDWEPSPQKLVEVQKARLLVYNGAGFEPWVDKLLHDVTGKKIIVIETTRGLDLLTP